MGGSSSAVMDVLVRHMPNYAIDSVRLLGTGLDPAAYEVNGELILRFSKAREGRSRALAIRREARLLRVVRKLSTVPTPEPRSGSPGQFRYQAVSAPFWLPFTLRPSLGPLASPKSTGSRWSRCATKRRRPSRRRRSAFRQDIITA